MGKKGFLQKAKPFFRDFWFVWKYLLIPFFTVYLMWWACLWFGVTFHQIGIIAVFLPAIPVTIFIWKIRREIEKREEEEGVERGWYQREHRPLPSESGYSA